MSTAISLGCGQDRQISVRSYNEKRRCRLFRGFRFRFGFAANGVFGHVDQFVNRFFQMTLWSPFLPVIGGDRNRMPSIYVHDLVQCVLVSLSTKGFHKQIIGLGGAKVHAFQAIMQHILCWGGCRRLLLPLSYEVVERLGYGGQRVMPLMLTVDQVKLLHHDNFCQPQARTAIALGVTVHDLMAMKADAVLSKPLLKLDRS